MRQTWVRMGLGLLLSLGLASTAVGQTAQAPTVAVLYFDYTGADPELQVLKKGLAQMLITDLADHAGVRIVERDRLEEVLGELKLGQTKALDKATVARVGKLLGARYLILGSYFHALSTFRIDARIVAVETGEVVDSAGANGDASRFLELEQKVSQALSAALAELPAVAVPKQGRRKAPPPAKGPEKALAMRTVLGFSRGLDAKDRGDRKVAEAELRAVVAEHPGFAVAQAELDSLLK